MLSRRCRMMNYCSFACDPSLTHRLGPNFSRRLFRFGDGGQHRGLGLIDVDARMMTAVQVDRGLERAQLKLLLDSVGPSSLMRAR